MLKQKKKKKKASPSTKPGNSQILESSVHLCKKHEMRIKKTLDTKETCFGSPFEL